jgi:serine/threonine-protein kinase
MSLGAGTRLGPYEITGQIGAGGMGVVWRATDTHLGRQVAIKALPDGFAQDPERLARFELEARTLASLNHANIAIVHGLERAGGVRALVMELVDGETLAERIARGPIPFDEALPIAVQIADGLTAAHEAGIVHRDLKPANIKVRPDGTVKVLDFGLVKVLTTGADPVTDHSPTITSPAMTVAGVILGTAAYMSPEQARGKTVDRRTDVWSFGCVLFEMLSGRRAFEDEDVSLTLSRVLRDEPNLNLLPATVPARVRRAISVCLQKDPRKRASAVHDVRLALEGAFGDSENAALHATPGRRAWPIVAIGAVAVAAIAVALAVVSRAGTGIERRVNRFEYRLPDDQAFRNTGRSVIAVSPDGRHIVYNTTTGLFVRSMDALEARLIPGTEGSVTSPIFSPDGRSIAYFQQRQLRRVPINGGAPVVICGADNPFGVNWGEDDAILFGQRSGIMRVSASGGDPVLVVPARDGEILHGPQALPGGDSLLFSTATESGDDRWNSAKVVVQSRSTGARRILVTGSEARYVPSGHLLYAVRDALFAVAFDPRNLEIRGAAVPVVEAVARSGDASATSGVANYGISADGSLVYVPSGSSRWPAAALGAVPSSTLVWVNRKGEEEALGTPARSYLYPRLSPDETRVALDVRDEQSDIWVWHLRQRTLRPFTSTNAIDADPVWSPDGTRILWTSARSETFDLYWQAADGTGKAERLTETPVREQPTSFDPGGRRLVFSVDSRGRTELSSDVAMLSLNGDKQVTTLLGSNSVEQNAEISPDGRWLAYQSDESGRFEVYVRTFPAVERGVWRVSTTGGRQPLWARSGRALFFLADDGALMEVPVESAPGDSRFNWGATVQITGGKGFLTSSMAGGTLPSDFLRTYDVSADGQRFLRIKVAAVGDDPQFVIVVQNWIEELKRLVPAR